MRGVQMFFSKHSSPCVGFQNVQKQNVSPNEKTTRKRTFAEFLSEEFRGGLRAIQQAPEGCLFLLRYAEALTVAALELVLGVHPSAVDQIAGIHRQYIVHRRTANFCLQREKHAKQYAMRRALVNEG